MFLLLHFYTVVVISKFKILKRERSHSRERCLKRKDNLKILLLKVNKMKFSHEHEVDPMFEVYKKLDSSFLHHQMNNELELILKNIYENQIPCFASTLIFPNFDDLKGMIEFQIPQESHCFFLEAEWLSSCVFSNFKCEKFLFLFLAWKKKCRYES